MEEKLRKIREAVITLLTVALVPFCMFLTTVAFIIFLIGYKGVQHLKISVNSEQIEDIKCSRLKDEDGMSCVFTVWIKEDKDEEEIVIETSK